MDYHTHPGKPISEQCRPLLLEVRRPIVIEPLLDKSQPQLPTLSKKKNGKYADRKRDLCRASEISVTTHHKSEHKYLLNLPPLSRPNAAKAQDTMKFILVTLPALLAPAAAFTSGGAHPHRPTFSTALPGMLDDAILGLKPFHGAGNGADKLDEQWEAQQAILRERKGHFDKQALKKKYVGGGPGAFMTEAMRKQAPADVVPSASEWTAPGTTKKAEAKKFRFPWEKKGSAP